MLCTYHKKMPESGHVGIFMGWMPKDGNPIWLNRAFHVSTTIIRFVVASAAKAKLGALCHNCQTRILFWLTLVKTGHPQPRTPIHWDNATAVGIANNTIKQQQLRSIKMRFFWVGHKIAQEMYALQWHPGQGNLANYQSKHHVGSCHATVIPWYLHMENSLRVLPRAQRPSTLKGCVGILKDRYICKVPLLWAPQVQRTSHVTSNVTAIDGTCYLVMIPPIPTWSDLVRSLPGFSRSMLLPFSLQWLV